jgi:hypothetical protein
MQDNYMIEEGKKQKTPSVAKTDGEKHYENKTNLLFQ